MIDDRLLYEVKRDGHHYCLAVAVQITKFPDEHEVYGGQIGLRFANADFGDNIFPGEFVKETRTGFVWRHPTRGEWTFSRLTDRQWQQVRKGVIGGSTLPDSAQEAAEWYRRYYTEGGVLRGRQDRNGNPIDD